MGIFDDQKILEDQMLNNTASGITEMARKIRTAYRHSPAVKNSYCQYQHLMGIREPEDAECEHFYILLAYNLLKCLVSSEKAFREYVQTHPEPILLPVDELKRLVAEKEKR